MKIKINKKLRISLISVAIVLSFLTVFLIYSKVYNPGFEEQKIPVYSYLSNGSINYDVYLKPNNLYKSNKLEEGKLYISEFVDYIDTNLKYEFNGETNADIRGEYNIVAKVQGFTGEGEKLLNIWEKDFPITKYKLINTNDGKVSINENIKLNLTQYNAFVEEIKESSKINCDTSLTLLMNVNLNGDTDEGNFKEAISPSLTIPLDESMFAITGNNIIDQPGTIEKISQVQIPVNKNQVILYGIILVFLIIALIILIFFTEIESSKDPLEKELKKIFKKHGDRLVALSSNIQTKEFLIVKSMEDLVKIADETEKPIFYKYSDDYKEINKFYVFNRNEIYVLDLGHLIDSEYNDVKKDIIHKRPLEQIKIES